MKLGLSVHSVLGTMDRHQVRRPSTEDGLVWLPVIGRTCLGLPGFGAGLAAERGRVPLLIVPPTPITTFNAPKPQARNNTSFSPSFGGFSRSNNVRLPCGRHIN